MKLVGELGGTPFIAFRSNATGRDGGLFAQMFRYYSFRRDEFLAHYHKRSNVEATFSMIKAKFGDHLRSKTPMAMANEAWAKVPCHNLCVLVQSAYELGIAATFWRDDARATPIDVVGEPIVADDIEVWAWV